MYYDLEAQARNHQLCLTYKKLPSYCIWMKNNIENETISQRIHWWNQMKKDVENNNTLCDEWIEYLNSLKKNLNEIKSKNNHDK